MVNGRLFVPNVWPQKKKMEKFKLTVRVHDLKIGQVFMFSGGWKKVLDIKNGLVYYKVYTEQYNSSHQVNDTLMAGSKMLVEVLPDPFDMDWWGKRKNE